MYYEGNRGGIEALVEDLLNLDIGLNVYVKNYTFFYTFYKEDPKENWFKVLDNHTGTLYTFYSFNKGHDNPEYNVSTCSFSLFLRGWLNLCNDNEVRFWFE